MDPKEVVLVPRQVRSSQISVRLFSPYMPQSEKESKEESLIPLKESINCPVKPVISTEMQSDAEPTVRGTKQEREEEKAGLLLFTSKGLREPGTAQCQVKGDEKSLDARFQRHLNRLLDLKIKLQANPTSQLQIAEAVYRALLYHSLYEITSIP